MASLWPYLAIHARVALLVTVAITCVVLVAWSATKRISFLRHPFVDRILMPVLVLAYGIGYLAWGEKVSHQGGMGWDGIRFSAWAKNFHKAIFVDGQNHYYLQKSLPSAIVHYGMRALGVPFTDRNVIVAFGVLDIFCWTCLAIAWVRIVKLTSLSRPAAWLGFVLLFVSYSGLKHYYYNPVLVDSFGLFIAAAIVVAHLSRWNLAIAPLAFLGGFVIPGLLPLFGAILLCFERREMLVREARGLGMAVALAGACVVANRAMATIDSGAIIANGAQQIDPALLPLSLGAMVIYLVALCAPLASYWPSARDVWLSLRLRWVPVVVLALWGIHALVDAYKNRITDVTVAGYYEAVLMLGVVKPLVSLAAHTGFLGPVLLLCVVMRREIARAAWTLGPGIVLATGAGFVLTLDSESRHLIFFMPILATLVALAYDRIGGAHHPGKVLLVAVLSIFLSKAWLPHETPPLAQNYERLFMSMGPWMTMANYGAQGAATLVSGIVLWAAFRR